MSFTKSSKTAFFCKLNYQVDDCWKKYQKHKRCVFLNGANRTTGWEESPSFVSPLHFCTADQESHTKWRRWWVWIDGKNPSPPPFDKWNGPHMRALTVDTYLSYQIVLNQSLPCKRSCAYWSTFWGTKSPLHLFCWESCWVWDTKSKVTFLLSSPICR